MCSSLGPIFSVRCRNSNRSACESKDKHFCFLACTTALAYRCHLLGCCMDRPPSFLGVIRVSSVSAATCPLAYEVRSVLSSSSLGVKSCSSLQSLLSRSLFHHSRHSLFALSLQCTWFQRYTTHHHAYWVWGHRQAEIQQHLELSNV